METINLGIEEAKKNSFFEMLELIDFRDDLRYK